MAERKLKRTGWNGFVSDGLRTPIITVVLELVACDTSPVVSLFHSMRVCSLDAVSPRAHEGEVGGGHPALSRETV